MNDQTEVCLNIWFFVDSGTRLIYRAAARAYSLPGSDDDKGRILKSLSGSDYHMSKHFSLSKYKTNLVEPNGNMLKVDGFPQRDLNVVFPDILDMICVGLEAPSQVRRELPRLIR